MFRFSLALIALLVGAGCQRDHPQSTLLPESPAARSIDVLWWVLFYISAAVFVIVLFLTVVAIFRGRRREPAAPLGTKFIVAGGIVLPTVVLFVLLFMTVRSTVALSPPPDPAVTIRVTGNQFWWHVEYVDLGIVDANELHIPVGAPVRLELVARDVIHSFWVPRLHGKRDLMPDHISTFWIQADRAGVYRGQCAEFCGVQHALMAFEVIAIPRHEFDRWAQARRAPPPAPKDESARRGQRAFMQACANCHAVAGTDAVARIGPDLTHLGSRRLLAAASIPNTRENLREWIVHPQRIKPGNLMPATPLPSEELEPLLDYLEGLK